MSPFNFPLRAFAAALAVLATGGGAATAQIAPPFSAAERALIEPALGDCGARPSAPPGALDDQGLWEGLVRRARVSLGQRTRPAQIDRFWAIEPARRDVEAEIAAARRAGTLASWIAGLEPPFPQYRALIAGCRRYAGLVEVGGWEPIPAAGPLREGDRDPQVAMLRLRLAREGFGPATAEDPELFGPQLAADLTAFQQRRGLDADAVLGPKTRAALNVTAEERLMQIQANLERWRWLPRALPADRVEVDAGGAQARLYRGGAPVLAMKAVVGDPRHRTPMFASRLESIVFNPPWIVPTSIATKEILPKARRNPGYLSRNNFSYQSGRLVQAPGPTNALGLVKFDLPSPFGVYLHDTPGKSAFERVDRHLSHGCMRLEKPRELATALLQPQGGSAETVEAAIAAGATTRVYLDRPVPLYVVYWTAVATETGEVEFRPDAYGWDAKLMAALGQVWPAADELAALARPATDCMTADD